MYNILVSIFIIIILLIIFIWRENSIHRSILNGVWVGSNDFITESETDSFILIIDSKDKVNMAVTVNVDGIEIENSICEVNIDQNITSVFSPIKHYIVEGYIDGFLPSKFNMKLDIVAGILVIEKNDNIYAVLVKENNI